MFKGACCNRTLSTRYARVRNGVYFMWHIHNSYIKKTRHLVGYVNGSANNYFVKSSLELNSVALRHPLYAIARSLSHGKCWVVNYAFIVLAYSYYFVRVRTFCAQRHTRDQWWAKNSNIIKVHWNQTTAMVDPMGRARVLLIIELL